MVDLVETRPISIVAMRGHINQLLLDYFTSLISNGDLHI